MILKGRIPQKKLEGIKVIFNEENGISDLHTDRNIAGKKRF